MLKNKEQLAIEALAVAYGLLMTIGDDHLTEGQQELKDKILAVANCLLFKGEAEN